MHDAEHDFKDSVFKVIGHVKDEFRFFMLLKFLTGRWLVHLVGGRLVGGRWSVGRWLMVGGRLVGGFKEITSITRLVSEDPQVLLSLINGFSVF